MHICGDYLCVRSRFTPDPAGGSPWLATIGGRQTDDVLRDAPPWVGTRGVARLAGTKLDSGTTRVRIDGAAPAAMPEAAAAVLGEIIRGYLGAHGLGVTVEPRSGRMWG